MMQREYPTGCRCNLDPYPSGIQRVHEESCPFATFTAADLAQCRRAFPTDPRGQVDKGARVHEPKMCCSTITHKNMIGVSSAVTYCTLPIGHGGQCSGPIPRELERNTFDKGKTGR